MTLSAAAAGGSVRRRWAPSALGSTALKFWVDANASSTITETSGAVSTWADRSGNSRDLTQSSSGARPVLTSNVQNGLPIVRFDGSNDYMVTASSGVTAQPYTWAWIFKPSETANFRRIVGSGNDNGNVDIMGGGAAKYQMWAGTGAQNLGSVTTAFTILVASFDGGSSNFRQNGSATASNLNPSTGYPTSLRLAASFVPDGFLSCDFGEVLFIGGAVTTADKQSIEGYLAHKWGLLANLPSDHPYKTFHP